MQLTYSGRLGPRWSLQPTHKALLGLGRGAAARAAHQAAGQSGAVAAAKAEPAGPRPGLHGFTSHIVPVPQGSPTRQADKAGPAAAHPRVLQVGGVLLLLGTGGLPWWVLLNAKDLLGRVMGLSAADG